MRHINSHLEVFAFLCRNKPALEKDYGIIQREMEKVTKSAEGRLGNRLLRTRWNSYSPRALSGKWSLYGLDKGKLRRVDKIRRQHSLPAAQREGYSVERRPAEFGNRLCAPFQKSIHQTSMINYYASNLRYTYLFSSLCIQLQ